MGAGDSDGPGGSAIEAGSGAPPARYALHYDLRLERVLVRVLKYWDFTCTILTFRRRLPRHRGVVQRHWLPGYMFVEFDAEHDAWQRIVYAPGVIDLLGAPTPIPEAVYHNLVLRCPDIVTDNDVETVIPVGSEVEILDGALQGRRAVVSGSRGDSVQVVVFAFNRLIHAELRTKHVVVLG